MESLLNFLSAAIYLVIFLFILVIAIYVVCSIFLNKFNKLVYGKGTPMAWLPFANVYLLGKLTINKMVGWILVICMLLIGIQVGGHALLPENIKSVVSIIYSVAVLVLFIYAIVKYFKIKNSRQNN